MIDKITLYTPDFIIKSDQLTVYPFQKSINNNHCNDPVLFEMPGGKKIRGCRSEGHFDNFSIAIRHSPSGGPNAFISFNWSRLAGIEPLSTEEMSQKQALTALINLNDEIEALGIQCDLLTSSMCRIELFRNVSLAEPLESYYSVIEKGRPTQMVQTKWAGATFQWSNTQHRFVIYNKMAECEKKGKCSKKAASDNVTRFEWRLLTAKKIRSALGLISPLDLFFEWSAPSEAYISFLQKTIFKVQPKNSAAELWSLSALLDEVSAYSTFTSFIKDLGWRNLSKRCPTETLDHLIDQLQVSSASKRRYKRAIRETLNSEEGLSTVPQSQLQEELRQKLIDAPRALREAA